MAVTKNATIGVPTLDTGSSIRDLREWVDALGQVRAIGFSGPPVPGKDGAFAVVPSGVTLESLAGYLDEYAIKPHLRSGIVQVQSLDDFLAATQAWLVPQKTVVGIAPGEGVGLRATAVFDYHTRGETKSATDGEWGRFKAAFALDASDAHREWATVTGRELTTPEFAAFVENRLLDLYLPVDDGGTEEATVRCAEVAARLGVRFASPSDVMLASRGLQITSRRTVKDAITLDDSSVQIEFAESNQASLVVPSLFATRYWLWNGVEAITIPWRLRYRVTERGLLWTVRPFDLSNIIREAYQRVTDRVRKALEGTEALVYSGSVTTPDAR